MISRFCDHDIDSLITYGIGNNIIATSVRILGIDIPQRNALISISHFAFATDLFQKALGRAQVKIDKNSWFICQ
jgi:hypothetical protein